MSQVLLNIPLTMTKEEAQQILIKASQLRLHWRFLQNIKEVNSAQVIQVEDYRYNIECELLEFIQGGKVI